MAVSKRIRFEVLRRDNHQCRYCHSTENPLTVDHVVPVALGGTDEPGNLVAACRDCNAGKASSSPDATYVEDVRQDALRHAELLKQAYAVVVARMGDREDYIEEFQNNYSYGLPNDAWRNSVGRFFDMGVPIEIVADAAQIASRSDRRFYGDGRFRYACGIIWNQVQAVSEAAELKSALAGAFVTEDEMQFRIHDAYMAGWQSGRLERGAADA